MKDAFGGEETTRWGALSLAGWRGRCDLLLVTVSTFLLSMTYCELCMLARTRHYNVCWTRA